MFSCMNNHEKIYFKTSICPACALIEDIESLGRLVLELEKKQFKQDLPREEKEGDNDEPAIIHTLDLHYSISNGGDGSASIQFVESAELATFLQEHDCYDEGFAEVCSGTIKLQSTSAITHREHICTIEDCIEEYEECGYENKENIAKLKAMKERRDDKR